MKVTDSRIVYKLIDLGYAKELGVSSMARSFVGTLQYVAPELFLEHDYTKSVDYWSLGLLAHEIVTGKEFMRRILPYFLCFPLIRIQLYFATRSKSRFIS